MYYYITAVWKTDGALRNETLRLCSRYVFWHKWMFLQNYESTANLRYKVEQQFAESRCFLHPSFHSLKSKSYAPRRLIWFKPIMKVLYIQCISERFSAFSSALIHSYWIISDNRKLLPTALIMMVKW